MSKILVEFNKETGLGAYICYDTWARNPRTEYDCVGVMSCYHRRYALGDEGVHAQLLREVRKSRHYRAAWDDPDSRYFRDMDSPAALRRTLDDCGYETLPVYLYDHGGLSVSTSAYSCPWDSGQLGFIACSPEKGRYEWGKRWREAARRYMRGEVEEYDQYLRGDVWCVELIDRDGEIIESCCGFFGQDAAEGEARGMLKFAVAEAQKRSAANAAAVIKCETYVG